jgi:hypothetical protein
MSRSTLWRLVPVAACLTALAVGAQEVPPPSEVTPDPWPKSATQNGTQYTIFQPQLDSWDDYHYAAHAAVQVIPAGTKSPVFGVIEITATTIVDRPNRVVHIENLTIAEAKFPSQPQQAPLWRAEMQQIASSGPSTMSLGRLEQAVRIEGAQRKSQRVPVENPPPQIVFTQGAAVLVLIHGDPIWSSVSGTSLQRAVNTRACLLRDPSGTLYVHVLDGFMTAPGLAGPWSMAMFPPADASTAASTLGQKGLCDLMAGKPDPVTGIRPSLTNGAPQVVAATHPTEIITTSGPLEWQPLESTPLLYVSNTTGNVFRDLNDQQVYVLVTGRWFRSATLAGPWAHIPGKDLPVDFSQIPDWSVKENVKASVPGTSQAAQAAIAAEIPHMATVYVDKVSFKPIVSGAPVLKPVPDTGFMYVFNSPQPIIMVSPTQWYAVQAGVWFTASSLQGPWLVATSIPAEIYSIPPSSPIFYVTYVQIYDTGPGVVVVGYTPGYTGVIITPDGTIVYGTGYVYPAYVSATVWYPPPVTYGYAANPTYTPATGFAMGFAVGWAVASACYAPAPYWGPMPYYYHPPVPYGGAYYGAAYGAHGGYAAWGPGGYSASTGNMYSHYGSTSAVTRQSAGYNAYTGTAWSGKSGASYNSTTGRVSAGQSGTATNAYTGGYASGERGSTYNPNTGVSASGGKATVGNAYTGQQTTVGHADVTGPGGQSTQVARAGNEVYGDHDGNAYSYNSTTGQTQKYNSSTNSWQNTSKPSDTATGQQVSQSRSAGDASSASSAWGGDKSSGSGGSSDRSFSGSSSWGGGGDRSSGGGSWGGGGDRSSGSSSWGGGGGGRSSGGGGWGGFHGGGGRR